MRGMEVCRFTRFGRVSALLQEHPSTQVDTAVNSLVRIHLSQALPVLACVIVVPYKGCLAVGAFIRKQTAFCPSGVCFESI